jgi:hypothetical protein
VAAAESPALRVVAFDPMATRVSVVVRLASSPPADRAQLPRSEQVWAQSVAFAPLPQRSPAGWLCPIQDRCIPVGYLGACQRDKGHSARRQGTLQEPAWIWPFGDLGGRWSRADCTGGSPGHRSAAQSPEGNDAPSDRVPKIPLTFGTMRRVARKWLWWCVILGGLGVVLLLRKSESDQIEDDLQAIADAVCFTGRSPTPARVAAMRASLAEHVADPVTINVAPSGDISLAADSLLEGILDFSSGHAGLGLTLRNTGVKVDPGGHRATAKGEALLEIVEPSGERRGEPRRFTATFERNARDWVLVHAQIAEPRIDQPEARP